jgi:NADH dehydrogenase FAD-containing subunit
MNIVIIGGGFAVLTRYGTLNQKGVQVILLIKTTIIFSAAFIISCYRSRTF